MRNVFHVSLDAYLNGVTFNPRVPEDASNAARDYLDSDTGTFENTKAERVCFSKTINGALNALSCVLSRNNPVLMFDRVYVYIPEKDFKSYKHRTNHQIIIDKDVFDANVTGEVWITEPVKLKLYAVINVDGIKYVKNKKCVSDRFGYRHKRKFFNYKFHYILSPRIVKKGCSD